MVTTVSNPIVPGFSPDPSVIGVDGTFFLVTSSFHVFPGLPIYASKNLKSWIHIGKKTTEHFRYMAPANTPSGNAINRQSQLSLARATTRTFALDTGNSMVAVAGLFAATIRHHQGSFYIICTNSWEEENGGWKLQNFYVTTTDIWSDQWSDPINYEWHGIDPSLFFDADGRAYVQGNIIIDRTIQPSGTIKQAEIDISTGKLLTAIKEIWEGFAKYDTDGPHVYRKDGYYYLLVAEGGTFEHHMLSMARSKNIWGPYESYELNPVLTADGKDEYIQKTGHGDLFADSYGEWWAVVLAVRNKGDDRFPLGRETFLTPVSWPLGEFPTFPQPKISFDLPDSNTLALADLEVKQSLRVDDVYIRDPVLDHYEFSPNGSCIKMIADTNDLSCPVGTASFVGKRQRKLVCSATTVMPCDKGLALYKDDFRHAEIFYNYNKAAVCFSVMTKTKGPPRSTEHPAQCTRLALEIRATELLHEFCYKLTEEGEWVTLAELDTFEMTERDMTGTIFGIFASGTTEANGTTCIFEEVRLD
jgi:beta-xylosidase